jgi:type II secretory pathway pseudopilin PulG
MREDRHPTARTPRLRATLHREAGFTLLEIIIAGVILTVLGLSYSAAIAVFLQASAAARELDDVREGARSQMEEILAWTNYATLASEFDGRTFAVGSLHAPQGPSAPPGIVSIDASDPDLLRVTVRIEWEGAKGNESYELATMLTGRSSQ